MNLQQNAQRMVPILQALAEGKTVQFRDQLIDLDPWTDFKGYNGTLPSGAHNKEYRVKPERRVIYVNEYPNRRVQGYPNRTEAKSKALSHASRIAVKYVEALGEEKE